MDGPPAKPSNGPLTRTWSWPEQRYALPILTFMALGIFAADLLVAGDYAASVLYVIPVILTTQWLPGKTGIALAICAGLILVGSLSARSGLDSAPALSNRGMVLVVLGVMALAMWRPAHLEAEEVDLDRDQLLEERFGRKLAEAALQNAQVRFQSIFESSHDGFAYATFDGAFLEVNTAMEQLTRYSRAELLSMTHRDVIFPDCAATEEEERRKLIASKQAVDFELEYSTKEGARVPVCINMFVVKGREGDATGLAMIVKDYTERKQTELVLRKIAEELHKKNEQLAQANQLLSAAQREAARVQRLSAIGQFAATVAHKIGTPLTALSGHVQLLKEDQSLTPHVRARLQIVETQIERTSTIIQDLLVYARRPDPVWSVVDVNACLQDCFALFQNECLRQRVACTLVLSPQPPTVSADRQQLQETFNHLVENALQAMPDGGTLTIRTSITEPAGPESSRRVAVEVVDTGIGIAPEHLAPIFQPFFTTKTMGRGTGLGLAIVQETVRTHGGQITVESEPGKGSRFTIFLPLVRPPT
ncbi:MAG TPA: ATP-binding protein [Nitrospiraceae bacterium]|nr:ATP-binding protein [Nitrospiraceae bacterium]